MLRIVHEGDRHDPRDLSVSCRFEGDFSEAFLEGVPGALLPGEALKNLVHTTAREQGHGEIEKFGLALCARVLADHPRVTRARVEIVEQPWNRLEAGGKAQGQAFVAGTPEQRTATVTSNGQQVAVVAGIENLTIMRSQALGPLARAGRRKRKAGWAAAAVRRDARRQVEYTSGDVTFGPIGKASARRSSKPSAVTAPQRATHPLFDRRRRACVVPGDRRGHALPAGTSLSPSRSLQRRHGESRRPVRHGRRTSRGRRSHHRARLSQLPLSLIGSSFAAVSIVLNAGRSVSSARRASRIPCRAARTAP